MKKKYTIKRALAGVLAAAQAFALAVWAAPETGAADFTLKSGFVDPSVTVSTMYYWKEGKPPIVRSRDGKTEGSTIGVEYPIIIAWDDRYYYNPSAASDIGTDLSSPLARDNDEKINQDDNNYNQPDEPVYADGRPAGFLAPYRTYQRGISLLTQTGIGQSLIQNGVAASMDVPTNLYAVPTEEGRYALEVGKGSNKWIVSEHNFDCKKRDGAGYWNSLDWYLLVRDYDKGRWIDPNYNVPVRYSMHHNVPNYSGSEDFGLNRRTWTIYAQDDGQYSIGTYGTARWDVQDWSSVGDGKHEWRDTAKQYVDGLIWSYTDTYISHNLGWKSNGGGAEGIQSFGDWKRDSFGFAQAANKSEYKFRVFYGEPNTVSFLQTDTKVQDGQVVNLDGPIVIGKNATVTVEDGGVLVVSGWVMNGGYILVKPGGMLIVQDQERLDGSYQYGVISCYEELANRKNGRISCDGIMIVNRDCKVIGSGIYGLQFGTGAQCVNYGQLISENFEVYGDHTIENRGDVSAVYAGWGLKGGGFAMANKRIAMGASFNGQGTIETTSSVKLASNAVYGAGANRVYINSASKVNKQLDMDNRKGYVTTAEPYTTTYTPKVDNANGLLYVTDGQNNRYDWYESLNGFARFTFENGTWKRYDFSGYCTMPAGMGMPSGGPGLASYSPQRNNFFITSGGKTYWYNATQAGGSFMDEDALTDSYYPGTVKFPPSATGASISGTVVKPQTAGPKAIDTEKSYYVVSAVDENLMLDTVFWWKDGIGIGVGSRDSQSSDSKWTFRPEAAQDGSTQYIIRNESGLCLEFYNDWSSGENFVRGLNGTSNSTDIRWRVTPDGDGYVITSATNPDLALDVPAEKVSKGNAQGNPIQLYQKNGSRNQRWKLIPTDELVDGGIYRIESWWLTSGNNTMVMDVSGQSHDNNAEIHIWHWTGGDNQKWEAVPQGTEVIDGHTINYYKFINVNSGMALDIDSDSYVSNVFTAQRTPVDDGDRQIWALIPFEGMGFKIVPKSTIHDGNPLALTTSGSGDGAYIKTSYSNGNESTLRWRFDRLK